MVRLVRIGIAVLAVLNLYWGAWAVVTPRGFFDTFPGLGHQWTAAYPPYNEHLVADLGATFLTLGLLLCIAAVVDDRRIRRVVLVGVVAFNTLHLLYHATHHGGLSGFDLDAGLTVLAAGVAGPIALLVLDRRREHASQSPRSP